MNILMIDDDADDRALFCEAVSELFPEATCSTLAYCDQIVKKINTIRPDIIFMDGHMFPISGKECLKEIKSDTYSSNIKVIIHSGSLSPSELNDLRALGADDVILKASSFHQLKANIERIIIDRFNLASRL